MAGISPIIVNQGESLNKIHHSVDYFTIKGKGFWGYLSNICRLKAVLKREKYDIIHAHYSLCGFVAKFAGANPLVVSLMGSDIKSKEWMRVVTRFFTYYLWDKVIVKSEENRNTLGWDNLFVLPNGVDLERFVPITRIEAMRYLDWDISKKYILFPGNTAWPEKNYQLAADAFLQLKGILPNIELKTILNVTNADMPFYYNACSAILLTSFWEGSPNAVKEAMACNIPIVTTNVGDVAWLLENVEYCYITPYDKNAIAEKLKYAVEFSDQNRTKGRDRIIELGLDSSSVAKRLKTIYEEILNNNEN